MNGRGIHSGTTRLLSVAIIALGAIVVVQSLSESSSALAARLLIGVLMVAAGVGRLYIDIRKGRGT
ncbi:MAG TPA: hypothetical protein VN618_09600 [Solirubrobacteraceae bacterium]|nr:hypothetical protein [Solirubrobacteraceae bacterium]